LEILRNNPTIDVNWGGEDKHQLTPLHGASFNGHDAIVAALLAHPDIDVNRRDSGWTAFSMACRFGSTSCVRLLLKDPRVKLNEPNGDRTTPLWHAVFWDHLEVIKWWIASGRDMDFSEPGEGFEPRATQYPDMTALLGRFRENQVRTRYEVRAELGCHEEMAADLFALVVFVSDGLLACGGGDVAPAAARSRFFGIATRLPVELQMVLCYRLAGSQQGEIIPGGIRELSFRDLARRVSPNN